MHQREVNFLSGAPKTLAAFEINRIKCIIQVNNCQALSISQSLNLSLSLRDRDRADTIITLYHTTPPETF